ncbi:hypothetical protein SAMN06295879_1591 [Agreia bicolorata]|uniref:DUF1684 domain-containing protein n=1 Tax=Agreia bicolorata TaxID=110935 RepID=A0A1T4XV41_9MICO|nr:DUF1684 domain-containing protein [Agreia bicolorata]SKA92925.1 hypothetical protein SAMN06295879_1591 [Agreia bicolorata]
MSTLQSESDVTVDDTAFAAEWQAWHDSHEKNRADPHGFLAVTSLNWLDETPTRYPDAPGEWSTSAAGPVVTLADGEQIVIDGQTISGSTEPVTYAFGIIAERGGVTASAGAAEFEVARRGGVDILRPRHPSHPTLVDYAGTPVYPPNPRWNVDGVFAPFDEPRPVTVGSVSEGLEHVYDSPGVIEFELGGESLSLTAFNGPTPGSLFVLFTDATSGVTTYAANRSLQIAAPYAEGRVTLDFNRATNLPCAYTEFATCPLPPAENRLPVGIEAGEKIPGKAAL